LDKQFELERLAQQAIIDNKAGTSTADQIATAKGRLAALDRVEPLARASVVQDTAGPLESFLSGIPDSAARANEALQSIAVDGLQSLDDGIADAITGAKSLADVFDNVADQIIAALIKIAIQQAIIKPLGGALSSLLGAGSSSFSFGGIDTAALFAGNNSTLQPLAGARAGGGPVSAGKSYLVGELGPEIFSPTSSGEIIANDAIASGRGVSVHVEPSAYFDVRVREVAAPLADSAAQRGAAGGAAMAQAAIARRANKRLGR
jgi:phage-related minor tail protein